MIAQAGGGAMETVIDGETGASTAAGPRSCPSGERFDTEAVDPQACVQNAARFGREAFREGFQAEVAHAMRQETDRPSEILAARRAAGDRPRLAAVRNLPGRRMYRRGLHRPTPRHTYAHMHDSSTLVTVAVCTRDRPAELAVTLDALEREAAAGLEVLVVDQSDRGGGLARRDEVRVIRDDGRGLSRARNVALRGPGPSGSRSWTTTAQWPRVSARAAGELRPGPRPTG